MGGKSKRKRIYVYLWLIHTVVWWKPAQPCKAIILQLEINLKKSPTEFLNDTLWILTSLSPHHTRYPAPGFSVSTPSFSAPGFHLSFNLASQVSLVFHQIAITQTLGDKSPKHTLCYRRTASG